MIYNIRRYKNYGIISPVPDGKLAATLLKYMTYEKQGIEFMANRMWGIVHLYNIKKGTFPWGFKKLVENILLQWCEQTGDKYAFDLKREFPDKILFSQTLRAYQIDAINSLLLNNGGILSMPTGSGKTKTVIEYLKHMHRKAVVIVTTLDIKRQWEEQVKDIDFISIINWQSKRVNELVEDNDIIVYDECHHVSAKSIYKTAVSCKTTAIIVGVSATTNREDGEDMRLMAALGNIVYKISRRELIEQDFLCDAEIRYVNIDYPIDSHLDYQSEYKKYIVDNVARNHKIRDIVLHHILMRHTILILVTQIDHGQFLFDSLPVTRKLYVNGGVKDRVFNLRDYDVIVASNIFDEGVDLPALDVLILAGSGKSENRLTQRIGRVLRPSVAKNKAIIYDFCDRGKYMGAHYKKRRKALETEFYVVDYDEI